MVYTALAIRALQTYLPAAVRPTAADRIAKARHYLTTAPPTDAQGESFRLMGLVWAGAAPALIAKQAARVRAAQLANGGWSQKPGMPADAYATGQALYALHAGGVRPTARVFRDGTAFLRKTQAEDGTWFVRSRTLGFQPYIETGFPYGRDQFLSAAATAWGVAALALTL